MRRGYEEQIGSGKGVFLDRKKGRLVPKIGSYFDFAKMKSISTAASVVLAAEYERIGELMGDVPPTVNLHLWNKDVFTRLYQLGLFEVLGHIPVADEKLVEDGPTMTMQIVSAKHADESKIETIDLALGSLGRFIVGSDLEMLKKFDATVVTVLTTLTEAMSNVTQHAYPVGHTFEFEHIDRFWVAATANRINRELTVVFYDQGATIPVTYPRLPRRNLVQKLMNRVIKRPEFDYQHDGTYIRLAMRYGGSRTDEPYRGKGFPQMFDILQQIGSGTLTVWSRGGWCSRSARGKMSSGSLGHSIGGTLIEMKVALPDYSDWESA